MHKRLIIITVPPKEVVDVVQDLRTSICVNSGAMAALAYPPHVTMRTGVIVPYDNMEGFLEAFGQVAKGISPFTMQTNGLYFGTYEKQGERKYLAAYQIRMDTPIFSAHTKLLAYSQYQKGPQYNFHPHMTLAFDDLNETSWNGLKERMTSSYHALPDLQWTCDNVGLYHFTGEKWEPFEVFMLGSE